MQFRVAEMQSSLSNSGMWVLGIGFRLCLKSKPLGGERMTEKRNRENVIAEITLSHLIRLGNKQGCPVSQQQALAFLNQDGRAFEMWKYMMQAAEDFIADRLFQHSVSAREHAGFVSRPGSVRLVGNAAR